MLPIPINAARDNEEVLPGFRPYSGIVDDGDHGRAAGFHHIGHLPSVGRECVDQDLSSFLSAAAPDNVESLGFGLEYAGGKGRDPEVGVTFDQTPLFSGQVVDPELVSGL